MAVSRIGTQVFGVNIGDPSCEIAHAVPARPMLNARSERLHTAGLHKEDCTMRYELGLKILGTALASPCSVGVG